MKIKELKENEPLKVFKITSQEFVPLCECKEEIIKPLMREVEHIYTMTFTDGEVANEREEESRNIDDFYIGKERFYLGKYAEPTLKIKNVCFKNYNFIITYLLSNEQGVLGRVGSVFSVIKDISVYLENKKDKAALKNAKQAFHDIHGSAFALRYPPFHLAFSLPNEFGYFDYEEVSEDIYSLQKKIGSK